MNQLSKLSESERNFLHRKFCERYKNRSTEIIFKYQGKDYDLNKMFNTEIGYVKKEKA